VLRHESNVRTRPRDMKDGRAELVFERRRDMETTAKKRERIKKSSIEEHILIFANTHLLRYEQASSQAK
jgi:hypothetical protein